MSEIIELDENYLIQRWHSIIADVNPSTIFAEHNFIESFKTLAVGEKVTSNLNFDSSIWKLSIGKNVMENFINASIAGALLYMSGATSLKASIVATLLKSFCKLEKIEFKKSDQVIYLSLPLKRHFLTPKEWYDFLPKEIKKDINQLAFYDFMDRLVLFGLAKKNDAYEEKYTILKKGKYLFQVHFF